MNTLHVERWFEPNRRYTLSRAITAFAVFPGHLNADRFGPVCELLPGVGLEICGNGFNDSTVRMRNGDCHYFVFWRDLAMAVPADKITREEEVGAW
jgi:hypothetical protein